ncbi:hypothetical protein DY000_02037514 [Brassica cretica]|uniref:Uncharacterized protein n=1 Tax=Brassica cretica TaxID=69181 RepID=A0ABQ7BC84_BRACR|nr:hypothetical protein DY000_02037514 [Brassica cretica]
MKLDDQAETRASGIGLKRDFRAKKAVLVFRYSSWAWTLANPNFDTVAGHGLLQTPIIIAMVQKPSDQRYQNMVIS